MGRYAFGDVKVQKREGNAKEIDNNLMNKLLLTRRNGILRPRIVRLPTSSQSVGANPARRSSLRPWLGPRQGDAVVLRRIYS